MASLPNQPTTPKKGRSLRHQLRIDMTPLVDLGFLLITFFVFTSSLSSSAATQLVIPKDGPPMNAPESATLTLIAAADDAVYAYTGLLEEAVQQNRVQKTNYSITSGAGALIRQKLAQLQQTGKSGNELLLLIKPTAEASYKNVVDLLDEVMINGVKRYALVQPEPQEVSIISRHSPASPGMH